MYKVDLWVWVESRDPAENQKFNAYCLELDRNGRSIRRTGEGQALASWNKATLTAIAEGLERFTANAQVVIHSENRWVLNMLKNRLDIWEAADFWKNKKEKIANESEWRRIAKAKHSLVITIDPIGFDRAKELMDRALNQWRDDESD